MRTTPLNDLHVELGGRLVDFAGWQLPLQFDGVVAEHTWCRNHAALFDVSHMGVVDVTGDDAAAAFERVTPAAIASLAPGRQRYALLTTDDGGILDDLMVTNTGAGLLVVVNASRREVDVPHLAAALGDLDVTLRESSALLALQGPAAAAVMERLAPETAEMVFLDARTVTIDGVEVWVSRSGYTGEDGFELCIDGADAERVARALLASDEVGPAGLGARDTLRLEAGLCLYGSDLDEATSPIEADLGWTIPRRRREAADFPGAGRIVAEIDAGPSRRRVGLAIDGARPVRAGAELRTPAGTRVGSVSSGGYGPTVERPVAMGYVDVGHTDPGTPLVADVRGRDVACSIADLPFVPARFRRAS